MKIIKGFISLEEVRRMADNIFGDLIKAVVFDSIINIRPSQGNKSRDVEDTKLRQRITGIVDAKVNYGL